MPTGLLGEAAPKKAVWLLEHGYSEAGLSFDALKGLDPPVGRILAHAAGRAGCDLYLGILQMREHGMPDYACVPHDVWTAEIGRAGQECALIDPKRDPT